MYALCGEGLNYWLTNVHSWPGAGQVLDDEEGS